MPVGVTSLSMLFADNALQSLKQQAFFFENIRLVFGETGTSIDKNAEINYLFDRGFLQPSFELENYVKKDRYEISDFGENLLMTLKVMSRHLVNKQALYIGTNVSNMTDYLASGSYVEAYLLRWLSKLDTICIDPFWKGFDPDIDRNVSKRDLYEITVTGLSLPAETVPWEDVFAFRSEATSQQQLRALRLWIADMAKGKLTYAEAIDKIQYLKEEYRRHMKGAGIRARNSILRTLVVGAADLIESAIKLKLKNLAEAPFKLVDAESDLVEADRKAIGRELAYVVRVEEIFQR